MPELTMISPLLKGMTDAELLSSHGDTSVYRVHHEATGLHFIVKHISIPESAETTNILVENGTIPTFDESPAYYKSIVDRYRAELTQFHNLSQTPNICSCLRFQVVRKIDQPGFDIYMLSPYRTSLLDFLHDVTISRKTAIQIGIDLCNALIVLRQNGFIHQNLKPENIFLENGNFTLSGFGLAAISDMQDNSMASQYVGCFSAPEAFRANSCLNQTMDLYSIGLLLYYIYNGNSIPFANESSSTDTPVNRRISGEELPAPLFVDPELDMLIRKACALNVEDRFQTPEELLEALQTYQLQDKATNQCVVPQQADSIPSTLQPEQLENTEESSISNNPQNTTEAVVSDEDTDVDSPVPNDAPTVPVDNAEVPEENTFISLEKTVKPSKQRNKKKLIAPLLIVITLLIVAVVGAYLYFDYTAIEVSDITIVDKGINYITVGMEAQNASSLIVTCSTTDGTDIATYHADNTVTFSNLEAGTTYNITVDSMDWHHVKGITGGTATTTTIAEILQFKASARDDQSVDVSLEVDGPAPDSWTIHCSSALAEDAVYTLDGNSGVLDGLLANCEYTLTLDGGVSYYLLGTSSISFSYSLPVFGSDLKVSAMDSESITVSWVSDSDATTAWTATCSGDDGYQSTITTGDCTATFTGVTSGTEYSITVTNESMSAPMYLTTDITASEVTTFDISTTGTSATLTWDAKGYALPETWILSYGLSSMLEPQTVEVTENEVELPYLLPGCTYTFTLSDPSGAEVTGTTEITDTTSATQYGTVPMPSDITFYAEQAEDSIVCVMTAPSSDLPDDTVVMVTLTDANGDILACGRTQSDSNSSVTVTIDTLPETAGTYGLSLYCNSQRLQSATFAIE